MCPRNCTFDEWDLENQDLHFHNTLWYHFRNGQPEGEGLNCIDEARDIVLVLLDWQLRNGRQEVLCFNVNNMRVEFRSLPVNWG